MTLIIAMLGNKFAIFRYLELLFHTLQEKYAFFECLQPLYLHCLYRAAATQMVERRWLRIRKVLESIPAAGYPKHPLQGVSSITPTKCWKGTIKLWPRLADSLALNLFLSLLEQSINTTCCRTFEKQLHTHKFLRNTRFVLKTCLFDIFFQVY